MRTAHTDQQSGRLKSSLQSIFKGGDAADPGAGDEAGSHHLATGCFCKLGPSEVGSDQAGDLNQGRE